MQLAGLIVEELSSYEKWNLKSWIQWTFFFPRSFKSLLDRYFFLQAWKLVLFEIFEKWFLYFVYLGKKNFMVFENLILNFCFVDWSTFCFLQSTSLWESLEFWRKFFFLCKSEEEIILQLDLSLHLFGE